MSASCRRSILPTPLWYATLFFFLSRGELCKARKEYASYGREKPIRKNKNAGRSRKGNGTSRAGEWDRPVPLRAVKCYFLNGRPTAALSLPSLAYRLAQGEPMNRPLGCSLNGSPHHTTDNPLLGEDVDDEDRSHGHQIGREGHRIVRRELALEHVLCERNRLIALISQRDQRQQEVVPSPQCGQNRKMIVQKIRQVEAPSIRAASSNEIGIERIKPIAINRLVPMPRIVYRIIKPS